MSGLRARAAALPAWVWLSAIVLTSAAIRIAISRRMVAPWIMSDELVYSELAKSFAAHGHFYLRGVASNGYGLVYPVLLAPAWLFARVPDAYIAAKAINGLVMSTAAIPGYFLARRVLSQSRALAVAALTVAVPSMLYTGTLMTENVFYPLFLVVALALVAMLEKPTARRQLLVLGLCAFAYLTRAQAVALVPAVATAPLLFALFNRYSWRKGLRPFLPLYGIFIGGGLLVALVTVARGRAFSSLLGAYQAATWGTYTVDGVSHFLLYHVAELDLYLGVLPFAALLALWFGARDLPAQARIFAAASLPLVVWLVIEVAAFASVNASNKIEERNLFYLAPLALIALLRIGADSHKRWRVLVPAAAIAGVLPFFVPYARFIGPPAVSDTFALLPWWWIQDHYIHLSSVRWAALGASLVAGLVFVYLPRRFSLVLPALVGAYFLATGVIVENGRHGVHVASAGGLLAGVPIAHPDWLDRKVGRDASVDYLRTGVAAINTIWENEFFNRSFSRVYGLVAPADDTLFETPVVRNAAGNLVAGSQIVRSQYVLTDGSIDLRGSAIAHDKRHGMILYRVNGPIVLLTKVTGLADGDTWSVGPVTYTRLDCQGGHLEVDLSSDEHLFKTKQTVSVREGGKIAASVTFAPTQKVHLNVPLHPTNGRCVVTFNADRTAVPAAVIKGSTDTRRLGAHFDSFVYTR